MPKEFKVSCARPTGGLVGEQEKTKATKSDESIKNMVLTKMAFD